VTDVFLSQHLGGRSEPLSGETFQGSTMQAPAGAGLIPGLESNLPKPPAGK